MEGDARGFVDGLQACFEALPDPRNENSCDHLLFDILAIAILAVACGADDWCGMAAFARVKLDWLKTFLKLPGGAPSHDTFRRVFGMLERDQFAASLFRRTQALQEASGGKLVAIDGKTLRRSFAKKSALESLAPGDRLGQRERLDARPGRLRREIERFSPPSRSCSNC